jgi:hypothetical protein
LDFSFYDFTFVADIISKSANNLTMEKKILDALTEKYTGVKESILRRVATKLAKTVTSEDDIATAVEGAFADVLEAYGDQRATDATKTAVLNYEKKHNLKDGKAISGDEPNQEPTSSEPGGDEAPAWAKKLIEANTALKERLDQLNGERMQSSRKSVIDKLIEPLPASIRKAYQRQELASMSEEDFTALQEEIKAEVDEINSDLSAKGAVFGKPAATGGRSDSNKGKASDAEADAVVKMMGGIK